MKKGLLLFFCIAALASAETYDIVTYGDVVTTTFDGTPVWQITSNQSSLGYGGLDIQITGAFTPADLTSLSATYNQTTGAFGGGAPRFSLWDPSNNEAYDYWGTNSSGCGGATDANAGSPNLNNTGNFITSGAVSLASNGFGGDNNPNGCVSFSSFLATGNVSTTNITDITLDLDAGSFGSPQVLDVASVEVNGNTFTPTVAATPEPATFGLFAFGLTVIGLASRKIRRDQITRNR